MRIMGRIGLVIFICTSGCNDSYKEVQPEDFGYAFFPLETGNFREYYVEQVNYSVQGTIDTIRYQLKELVADTFINQAGSPVFLLKRYKKLHDNPSWQMDSVWTAERSLTNLVVRENNVPYVKLIFPVVKQKTWDGNAFNTKAEEQYTYEYAYQPVTLNGKEYANTVKVIHRNNDDTIVKTDIRHEIYAENIGLINKESIILHYCTENECLGEQIIERGIVYRQELTAHGKE